MVFKTPCNTFCHGHYAYWLPRLCFALEGWHVAKVMCMYSHMSFVPASEYQFGVRVYAEKSNQTDDAESVVVTCF